MSEHHVTVSWSLQGSSFAYDDFNRDHQWTFPAGVRVPVSAAPEFLGSPECVDPEEAFVASLSSCHMLTFLAMASKQRFVVRSYQDSAVGYLEKNADGKLAIRRVELCPQIEFEGEGPDEAKLEKLHERAHKACFIANSVKTEVSVLSPKERTGCD